MHREEEAPIPRRRRLRGAQVLCDELSGQVGAEEAVCGGDEEARLGAAVCAASSADAVAARCRWSALLEFDGGDVSPPPAEVSAAADAAAAAAAAPHDALQPASVGGRVSGWARGRRRCCGRCRRCGSRGGRREVLLRRRGLGSRVRRSHQRLCRLAAAAAPPAPAAAADAAADAGANAGSAPPPQLDKPECCSKRSERSRWQHVARLGRGVGARLGGAVRQDPGTQADGLASQRQRWSGRKPPPLQQHQQQALCPGGRTVFDAATADGLCRGDAGRRRGGAPAEGSRCCCFCR